MDTFLNNGFHQSCPDSYHHHVLLFHLDLPHDRVSHLFDISLSMRADIELVFDIDAAGDVTIERE